MIKKTLLPVSISLKNGDIEVLEDKSKYFDCVENMTNRKKKIFEMKFEIF
jgi:hypothetical protein